MLGREIFLLDPFKAKPRTNLRGQTWTKIAGALNGLKEPKFVVSQRSVHDRFKLLADKFKKKMNAEDRGSGISPEMSELDSLLEEFLGLEQKYSEEYVQETAERMRKDEEDKENAEDMRLKAMETLRETQKRKANADGNEKKRKEKEQWIREIGKRKRKKQKQKKSAIKI